MKKVKLVIADDDNAPAHSFLKTIQFILENLM